MSDAAQLRLTLRDERVVVEVYVVPRAARSALLGLHDGRLKVALCAPPVDGEANRALVELIADALRVPRRQVQLIRGDKSRKKTLAIQGVSPAAVRALLP